jgi:hypothetical protein
MAIGILSMLSPLEDRIDRWATSGKATRILLHPEDFLRLSETKRETIGAKYNLPVEALGGARGIREFLNRQMSAEEREEQEAVIASQEVPFQSEE